MRRCCVLQLLKTAAQKGHSDTVTEVARSSLSPSPPQGQFAIKLMRNDSVEARAYFWREVAALQWVNKAQGVLHMIGFLPVLPPIAGMPTDGFAGILMPRASHGSLDTWLSKFRQARGGSGLPAAVVRYIFARALAVSKTCTPALVAAAV